VAEAWLLAAPVAGADSDGKTKAKASFENTGVQPEGEVEFQGKAHKSELEFEHLDPGPTYTLSCDGTQWASFQTDGEGRAELVFLSDPKRPGAPMLPGDPRGASFALSDGAQDVLTVVLSDPGELLLDFDPRGQLIEVFDGGTLILERTFPS